MSHYYWGYPPMHMDMEDDPSPVRGPGHLPHGPYGPRFPAHPGRPGRPFPHYPYRFPYQHPYNWHATSFEEDTATTHRLVERKQVVKDIIKAINGEYSAIICYGELAKKAPNEAARKQILEIRRDEEKHLKEISQIYYQITGRRASPKQTEQCAATYEAGLKQSFIDEQETVDFYNEVADKAQNKSVKQVFRRAALDEQNHAVWFLYLLQ